MEKVKKVTLSGMLFAIGLILPFFIGQIPAVGKMLRSRSCILKNAAPEAGATSVLQCVMRCRKNPIQNLF